MFDGCDCTTLSWRIAGIVGRDPGNTSTPAPSGLIIAHSEHTRPSPRAVSLARSQLGSPLASSAASPRIAGSAQYLHHARVAGAHPRQRGCQRGAKGANSVRRGCTRAAEPFWHFAAPGSSKDVATSALTLHLAKLDAAYGLNETRRHSVVRSATRPETRHLILHLEAPLMSFGGNVIDFNGPTLDFPLASLVTGLIANALGWTRGQGAKHQHLQNRVVMGSRLDRPGERLVDFQTAQLSKDDRGWTTRRNRRRAGRRYLRLASYPSSPLFGRRTGNCRTSPAAGRRGTHESHVAAALECPARPLFIGRKACLPSSRIYAGTTDANDVLAALKAWPLSSEASADPIRISVPASEETAQITIAPKAFQTCVIGLQGSMPRRQVHILSFSKSEFRVA